MVKATVPFPSDRNSHTSFPVRHFLSHNSSGAALLRLNNCTAVILLRVSRTVVLSAVLETDLTAALVQPQLGAERQALAVVFDCVFRQRRICDDDKMLFSPIAVSVDDAYLPPLYFKIV